MNALQIGGAIIGGGLLLRYFFGNRSGVPSDATSADAMPPVVPVDSDGNVVPQDANGGAKIPTPDMPTSGKVKIPIPKMPVGWKAAPRLLVKDGVYYYNPKFVAVLKEILLAYGAAPTNAENTRATLVAAGTAGNARVWVATHQAKGHTVVTGSALFEGASGQMGAPLIVVPKANVNAQHVGSTLAVLPYLPIG